MPYIRLNVTGANYDTHFISAEVNARRQEYLPVAGYMVVTKYSGTAQTLYDENKYKIITNNYKIQQSSAK